MEQDANVFNEDREEQLKAGRGTLRMLTTCWEQPLRDQTLGWCALQGDAIYDPSGHHPPPLTPHYPTVVCNAVMLLKTKRVALGLVEEPVPSRSRVDSYVLGEIAYSRRCPSILSKGYRQV